MGLVFLRGGFLFLRLCHLGIKRKCPYCINRSVRKKGQVFENVNSSAH